MLHFHYHLHFHHQHSPRSPLKTGLWSTQTPSFASSSSSPSSSSSSSPRSPLTSVVWNDREGHHLNQVFGVTGKFSNTSWNPPSCVSTTPVRFFHYYPIISPLSPCTTVANFYLPLQKGHHQALQTQFLKNHHQHLDHR